MERCCVCGCWCRCRCRCRCVDGSTGGGALVVCVVREQAGVRRAAAEGRRASVARPRRKRPHRLRRRAQERECFRADGLALRCGVLRRDRVPCGGAGGEADDGRGQGVRQRRDQADAADDGAGCRAGRQDLCGDGTEHVKRGVAASLVPPRHGLSKTRRWS
eukprot:1053759-Rhodomonas_salina.2